MTEEEQTSNQQPVSFPEQVQAIQQTISRLKEVIERREDQYDQLHKRYQEALRMQKPRFHFHWQDLQQEEKPGSRFSGLRHGRAWFHDHGPRRQYNATYHVEWGLFQKTSTGIDFSRGDGRNIAGSIRINHLGFLHIVLENMPWLSYRNNERETGFTIMEGSLHWQVWADPHEWSTRTPRWRDGWFHPADLLLGKMKYSTQDIETKDVLIHMPERDYPATARHFVSTWKRPRWKAQVVHRFDIQLKDTKGIPIPGKGENSWDCDDTAVDALICPASTVEEAVESLTRDVLRRRLHYGGPNWQPAPPQQKQG